MRTIGLAALPLLLVACRGDAPASALPAQSPAARACSGICGRVLDPGGKPLTQYRVAIFSAEPGARAMMKLPSGYPQMPGPLIGTADVRSPDGWFDVDGHGAKRVVVGISAMGYRIYQSAPFEPAVDRPAVVTLIASLKIKIRVMDEHDRPVAGVRLFFDTAARPVADALRMAAGVEPIARTDSAGTALVDQPYTPSASVLLVDDRHVPQRLTFAREAGSADVVLHEAVSLRGTARDSGGAVVPAAAVEARCEGWPPFQALARADGTFVFDRLPRARCDIVAARELINGIDAVVLDPVRGSTTADLRRTSEGVEVVIPPSGRISGRITGLDRIGDGYVAFARRGAEIISLPAGSDGIFSRRVPPGSWDLYGAFDETPTHLETAHAAVEVGDGSQARVELPFPNQTTIRISVNGRPPSAAELILEPRDPAIRTRARLRARTAGTWQVGGLDRGTYSARLRQGDWEIASDVEVPSTRDITVAMQTAELHVRDAAGHPIDADVRITHSTQRVNGVAIAAASEGPPALGVAGGGRHVNWEVPSGTYEVSIHAAGYKEATAALVLPGPVPHVVLQTIDRPFARVPLPPLLDPSRQVVFLPVIADLDARARYLWRSRGEERRGRLVVADQTVRRPSTVNMWSDREREETYARLKRLKTQPLFRAFEREQSVHTLARDAFGGVLVVPFETVPVRPPREWDEATSEAALFDASAIAGRWNKGPGLVLLSSPQLSPDGTEALVTATLFAGDPTETRLYSLVMRSGRWRVKEWWAIDTEPGC